MSKVFAMLMATVCAYDTAALQGAEDNIHAMIAEADADGSGCVSKEEAMNAVEEEWGKEEDAAWEMFADPESHEICDDAMIAGCDDNPEECIELFGEVGEE